MLSGTMTYWHHDRWTSAMKSAVDNLLATFRGKDRMNKVIAEYRKLVYVLS